MTIKEVFSVPEHSSFGDAALLMLRLAGGVAFMIHGWGKIQNPFGWMGPDADVPGFFQALAALSEFGGVGVGAGSAGSARLPGGGVHHGRRGVFARCSLGSSVCCAGGGPAYELALLYLCIAILLIAIGPGRLSLDRVIFGSRSTWSVECTDGGADRVDSEYQPHDRLEVCRLDVHSVLKPPCLEWQLCSRRLITNDREAREPMGGHQAASVPDGLPDDADHTFDPTRTQVFWRR